MTNLLRILAWLTAAAVTFATLGPANYRPHSDLGQSLEHTLAFVAVGLTFGLAYAHQRLFTSATMIVMIGVLEILQLWAPGRHARFGDFVADALGACAGIAIAIALEWIVHRLRRASADA